MQARRPCNALLNALRILGWRPPVELDAVDPAHGIVGELELLGEPEITLAAVAEPLDVLGQRDLEDLQPEWQGSVVVG